MLFDKVLDELLLRLIPLIFEQSFPSFKTGILEENLHWLSNDKSRLCAFLLSALQSMNPQPCALKKSILDVTAAVVKFTSCCASVKKEQRYTSPIEKLHQYSLLPLAIQRSTHRR
jgi:hypothetical protein